MTTPLSHLRRRGLGSAAPSFSPALPRVSLVFWGGGHESFFHTLLPQPPPAMKLVAAVASPAQWLWAVSELGLAGDAHGGLRPSLAGPSRPPNPARPWQVLESRPLTTPHGDLFSP